MKHNSFNRSTFLVNVILVSVWKLPLNQNSECGMEVRSAMFSWGKVFVVHVLVIRCCWSVAQYLTRIICTKHTANIHQDKIHLPYYHKQFERSPLFKGLQLLQCITPRAATSNFPFPLRRDMIRKLKIWQRYLYIHISFGSPLIETSKMLFWHMSGDELLWKMVEDIYCLKISRNKYLSYFHDFFSL